GWVISLRQKQKKLIMLPSETMIWQPEFTDKTLSRKTGAVQSLSFSKSVELHDKVIGHYLNIKHYQ
ncbi:TPA: IS1 family transposase, partial [Escherichia coli]